MTWALFFQIEVILLSVGLVIAFVITLHQSKKDDSFFKRVAALGAVFTTWGESIAKKQKSSTVDEHEQFLNRIAELAKQIKEKEEKNDE